MESAVVKCPRRTRNPAVQASSQIPALSWHYIAQMNRNLKAKNVAIQDSFAGMPGKFGREQDEATEGVSISVFQPNSDGR
jgi:hypothetical protein